MIKINSIYKALEGEGINVGQPENIIRFQGCKVGCVTCDTPDALEPSAGTPYTVDQIVEELVPNFPVLITGGDPVLQKEGLIELLKRLKEEKFWTSIELTGLTYEPEVVPLVNFLSLDLKTPSSGVKVTTQHVENINAYLAAHSNSQVKAVAANDKDLEIIIEVYRYLHDLHPYRPLVITPCWSVTEKSLDTKFLNHINEVLFTENVPFIRVIVQQHKIIYGHKRDV